MSTHSSYDSFGSESLSDNEAASSEPLEIKIDEGELKILERTLTNGVDEEYKDSVDSGSQLTRSTAALSRSVVTSIHSEQVYGERLSPEEAVSLVPPGDDGLVRYAIVIPDNFISNGKLIGGLNKQDYNVDQGTIKPRRPSLPITMTQLMTSLTRVPGPNGPRYIFNGILNGWPSLRHFELIELQKKRSLGSLHAPGYMHSLPQTWSRYWTAEKEGKEGISPAIKDTGKVYRATLRGAPWTSVGWSPKSPGFLFWYEAQRPEGPRVVYGIDAVNEVGGDVCTKVHMISHRYANLRESTRDKLTYHSVVFLEWDHGKFGTVVEGAFLNGIGGYKGKSNWYRDKDDGVTALYKAFPSEMVSPWLTTAAELRCFDVEARNLDEMKEYIANFTGPEKRFLDPHYTFSHSARLSYRSRSHIAQYLVNYISRDCSYSELSRNCQTLTADLCSFLAGKRDVVPYHPVNRFEYKNRTHLFLYESSMFTAKKRATLKGKVAW